MRNVLAVLLLLGAHAVPASAFVVTGDSNPNLAGRLGDYSCCSGDTVPGQSPVLVTGVDIVTCGTLEISASGRVSFTEVLGPGDNPDGDDTFTMTNYGDGLAAPMSVRTNSLLGVFLGDASPTGRPTPPQLDFSDTLQFSFLQPRVRQIFFIGDGLSSDSATDGPAGVVQEFVVPAGATRLYLGTSDGSGWFNNAGSFTVEVTAKEGNFRYACGQAADPPGIQASDALQILRGAVGQVFCPECVCDADRSGSVGASDALAVLRWSVGIQVDLLCECCMVF